MITNRDQVAPDVLRLILAFEGHKPSDQEELWCTFDSYVTALAEEGWTRNDIYQLMMSLEKKYSATMSSECSDALSNYITGLVGQVALGYIVRLPGEPSDLEEHAHFVRGLEWIKD
ncbi:MAG: hypothetical protein ABL974_21725 [Prosthecobacter sp.]